MTTLVIDIGSSSVRTLLFDDAQSFIPNAVVRRPHRFATDRNGASTAHPLELLQLVESCVGEILDHPHAKHLENVGMATFVGNMLGIDRDGNPVTPLITYADTRSRDVSPSANWDAKEAHHRTGAPFHSAYWPLQLHWLQQAEPYIYSKVAQWIDIATFVYSRWFDSSVPCSYSVASWSGLLNRDQLDWDTTLLQALQLSRAHVPTLADYTSTWSGLSTDYAKKWPALKNVPFYLAIGDGAAANIGSGATQSDEVALTIGTTAAIRRITTHLSDIPTGLWAYRVDADHHLLGGSTTEGGSIYAWLAQTLNLNMHGIEHHLTQTEPGKHGLTVLPLFSGERSPGYRSDAVGTIHGLRLSTTPLDIVQASLESIAVRLGYIADLVAPADATVYAAGNAIAASPAWAQIIANALNRPVAILAKPEVTARGVALLVNHGVTAHTPTVARTLYPNPAHVTILREQRQQQINLYQRFYGSS
jgi:gluconokinase